MVITRTKINTVYAVQYIDLLTSSITRTSSYIDAREYSMLTGLLTTGYSRSANQVGLF